MVARDRDGNREPGCMCMPHMTCVHCRNVAANSQREIDKQDRRTERRYGTRQPTYGRGREPRRHW